MDTVLTPLPGKKNLWGVAKLRGVGGGIRSLGTGAVKNLPVGGKATGGETKRS